MKTPSKAVVGFEWAAAEFAGEQPFLYLWTFTFENKTDAEEASQRWNSLLTVLRRELGDRWSGFRAFEEHPGGHGIHIHAIVDEWINAKQMWRWAALCRFGRVDVQKVPANRAKYLSKYIGKGSRPESLANKRLLAPFGKRARACWRKLSDVVRSCPKTRMWAALKALVPKWADLSFWKQRLMVANGLRMELVAHVEGGIEQAMARYALQGRLWGLQAGIQVEPFFVDA